MASVRASPRGSCPSAGLSCWKVSLYFFCCTTPRNERFLPTAVNMARKMGFLPLWSNLRAAANGTSLSSSKRPRKQNLTQSECHHPFKTVRTNLCFLLVLQQPMGRGGYPFSLVYFSSPPFKTVRPHCIFPLIFVTANGARWLSPQSRLF